MRQLEAIQAAAAVLVMQAEAGDAELTVVRLFGELLHARRATLYCWDGPELKRRAEWHEGSAFSVNGSTASAELSGRGTARIAHNGTGALVAPLEAGGDSIGSVLVEPSAGGQFDPGDVVAADRLAALAGPVLRTAWRVRDMEEANERLREVDHVKTEFLALASHELRAPITVLSGYLSLLEDGAFGVLPAASRELMPALNARLAEMEALINAMLETARVEEGRLQLNWDVVDLRATADEAVRRCELFAHPGQLIGLRCADVPVPVQGDSERLRTVVSNLVHNAIKYSPGHTDVHCSVRAEGDTAFISVSDTGLGIAPEDMGTLFTRFGRVRSDPAVRDISGTGLGLYVSRELARAHGGDIVVESTPGKGSTFTLALPLAR